MLPFIQMSTAFATVRPVVKHEILREGELFQRGSIYVDLIFNDIFFVKPAQVDQPAYRHVWVKGTLMFVQVHHAADEK